MAQNQHERRRHRMLVTRNTEYHLRDRTCVGVRDRRTQTWRGTHLALGRRLSGGVRVLKNGEVIPVEEGPSIGEAIYFACDEHELITSAITEVGRPPKVDLQNYAI